MSSKQVSKCKQRQRQRKPSATATQPVSPVMDSPAETADAIRGTAPSTNQTQPPKPRLVGRTLKIWLPIVLNGLLVTVVIFQSIYYERQSGTMEKTLKEMRISRETQQRAWISVTDGIMNWDRGKPEERFIVAITIKNSGNSPALNTVTEKSVSLSTDVPRSKTPLLPSDILDLQSQPTETPYVIGPGAEYTINIEHAPFDKKTISDLKSNKRRIKILGLVKYEDIFGQKHWVTFCAYTEFPSIGVVNCGGGIDEQQDTDDKQ